MILVVHPGSRIQGSKGIGSRIRIRNTEIWKHIVIILVSCLAWMSEGRAERGIRAVPAQRAAANGKTPMPTADGPIFYS
jgi:hypothetical protein